MSFGFGVGDIIAIAKLAKDIRDRFVDAPKQFEAISNEVTGLTNILQEMGDSLSQQILTDWQKKALEFALKECHTVLIKLEKVVAENYLLKPSNSHGFRDKSLRAWKRLTLEPNDIKELRSQVSMNVGFLNTFNGSLTSKVTLAIRDGVEQLHERQDTRERREEDQAILDWLTPIDYTPQQNDFISRRQAETGKWLIDSAEFQKWLQTEKKTLFCPGIPGAGKTILTAIVIDDLRKRFASDPTIGLAYIYCNFRRHEDQKVLNLVTSLLKQLSQSQTSIPDSVKDLYNRHKRAQSRPSLDEIVASLQSVASIYSRVFIVIDALDECQASDGTRTTFLSEMFNIQAQSHASIFATSRYIPEINDIFSESIHLEIKAAKEDVQRYLDGQMSQLPGCVRRSSELQEIIKTEIIKAVDGMFLLAQLYLDSLKGKMTPKAIRTALQKLPTGSEAYNHAYNDAMDRIKGQLPGEEEHAKRVLTWITCATRPLTVSELEHALAVEPKGSRLDPENICPIGDMVSVCAGLVTIDEESSIIRLVHYTTQEYFERTQSHWFPDAEAYITSTCITYLSFSAFESGCCQTEDFESGSYQTEDSESGSCQTEDQLDERLYSNKLYLYASCYWGYHCRKASPKCDDEAVNFLKCETNKVEAAIEAWMTHRSYPPWESRYSYPRRVAGVHLAAHFGLEGVLNALLDADCIDLEDGSNRTPLCWAAWAGHKDAMLLLIEKGAKLEATRLRCMTPFMYAAWDGHLAIVKILIEHGAKLEGRDEYGQTPLFHAVGKGHEAVARLLLENGAKIDAITHGGRTPLMEATRTGHEAIAKLLLEHGAEIETKDDDSYSPLAFAARNGDEAITRLLLENGAKVDGIGEDGRTPLIEATRTRHEAVVKLLLEHGADLEAEDGTSNSPLAWAAVGGNDAIAQLLLQHGANVESSDKYGGTPLFAAVMYSRECMVKLLLKHGAEPEVKDKEGMTPLLWAVNNGDEDMVKLLLENGAELEVQDNDGATPISIATEEGHEAILKLLFEHSADLKARETISG